MVRQSPNGHKTQDDYSMRKKNRPDLLAGNWLHARVLWRFPAMSAVQFFATSNLQTIPTPHAPRPQMDRWT
jgi:hypothetical protein